MTKQGNACGRPREMLLTVANAKQDEAKAEVEVKRCDGELKITEVKHHKQAGAL